MNFINIRLQQISLVCTRMAGFNNLNGKETMKELNVHCVCSTVFPLVSSHSSSSSIISFSLEKRKTRSEHNYASPQETKRFRVNGKEVNEIGVLSCFSVS